MRMPIRHQADTETGPAGPGRSAVGGYAATAVVAVRSGAPTQPVTPHDAAEVMRRHFPLEEPSRGDGRTGHAYGPMVVRAVGALDLGAPPDLLVVAHALHDVTFDTLAALQAAHEIGVRHGDSFAVTDRGALSGFTAIRLATALAARERYERVVVAVVEQDRLPYGDRLRRPADAPSGVAVALLLEATPGPGLRVHGRQGLRVASPQEVAAATAREAAAAVDGTSGVARVVLGSTVPSAWAHALVPGAAVTRAAAGALPATAVWETLAEDGARPGDGGVLVVEHDAQVGGVAVALLP
ncbi:hypothetical protein GC089_02705 [Cellulomonas sp. JZ18]|uniref:hypothetical protein n=1 Tax=Cellulomonas sp. JZ18 TaxID=2654191 RepID=UPI0012D47123|nr:hypothetical protein [Cellulomonas sp. JZ18]QGQ18367.1 hypothetical protein GC089_02705 [Cellulomonas sp. JZ18]